MEQADQEVKKYRYHFPIERHWMPHPITRAKCTQLVQVDFESEVLVICGRGYFSRLLKSSFLE